MSDLKTTLMRRDDITEEAAKALIEEAREDLHHKLECGEYVDDLDFMEEWFGLEPDYIMDLM